MPKEEAIKEVVDVDLCLRLVVNREVHGEWDRNGKGDGWWLQDGFRG
jgi:hypothetical protein